MEAIIINNTKEFIQLFLAGILISFYFPKKQKFKLRVAMTGIIGICLAILVAIGMFYASGQDIRLGIAFVRLDYFVLLLLNVVFVCFNFQVSIWVGFLTSLCAYAMENITSQIKTFLSIFDTDVIGIAEGIIIVTLVYGIIFFWSRGKLKNGIAEPNRIILLLNIFCLLMICIILPTTYYTYANQETNRQFYSVTLHIVSFISFIFDCMTIVVEITMVEKNKIKKESEQLNQLLTINQGQYELSKETIKAINRKYHDLKYYLDAQKEGGQLDKETTREIEDVMGFYDLLYQTGNVALDTVLSEYAIKCKNNQITFSCIVDGSLLDFMKPTDIYALFGNALDNALEHVKQYEPMYRVVSVSAIESNGLTMIHIENYCASQPNFIDGLPVTTKPDKQNHGFGTESIRYIANLYGGSHSVQYKDQLYSIDITFCHE